MRIYRSIQVSVLEETRSAYDTALRSPSQSIPSLWPQWQIRPFIRLERNIIWG